MPLNEQGKPTYKLDLLAPANGFINMNAHDAMGDVEATIFVCRLIKERAPVAWEQMLQCAAKARVERLINENKIFVLRDYYGVVKDHPLTRLGDEPNGHAVLAYDLSIEPTQLSILDDTQLAARLKRAPKPVRRIRPNTAPLVLPVEEATGVAALSYDTPLARRNALFAASGLVYRLIRLSSLERPSPSAHIEQQIYDGFPSAADSARMVQFHAAQWCDRANIAEQFHDVRYRELARRLIYAHCPESLPDDVRQQQERFIASRIVGHEIDSPPWSTLDKMDEEAAKMELGDHAPLAEMLSEFWEFLAARKRQAMVTLGLD